MNTTLLTVGLLVHCVSSQSPWQGYTSSAEEEQAGRTVSAVDWPTDPSASFEIPAHLAEISPSKEPLLGIDRKGRRVVVSKAAFETVHRADLPRLQAGSSHRLTRVLDPALKADPIATARFLIRSELILTYAHLESTLKLVKVRKIPRSGETLTEWKGSHVYFTSDRNERKLHFAVRIHPVSGEVWVDVLPRSPGARSL